MAEQVPIPSGSISDAASLLSERIREEGGGLTPEFDQPADAGAPPADDVAAEAEAEAEEVETEAEDTAGAEEPEGEVFELPGSLNELAEMLGVDPSAIYGLTVNLAGGDESRSLTIEEAKNLASKPAAGEAERMRFLDQKRAQEAELEAQRQALQQRRQEADTLAAVVFQGINAQEQQVAEAYQGLLRNVEFQTRDPQAYQVELLRHNATLEQIRAQKQGLMQQMDQVRGQMEAERQQAQEQAMKAGAERLREYIPEWHDQEAFQAGAATLREYVTQERFGTTAEELAMTSDPRVYYWAEMARRYEALQAKAKEKPTPRVSPKLRAGAQAVKLPQGRRAELEARKRLEESGSISDAQALIAARLGQTG